MKKKKILFFLSFRKKPFLLEFLKRAKFFFDYTLYLPSHLDLDERTFSFWKQNILQESDIINAFNNHSKNKIPKALSLKKKEILQIKNQFKRVTGGINGDIEKKIINLYKYLINYILSEKYDAVVFESTPHLGYDFLVYKIFKKLNKKIILFERNFYQNKYFVLNSYNKIKIKNKSISKIEKINNIKKQFLKFENRVFFYKNEFFLLLTSIIKFVLFLPVFFLRPKWDSYYLFNRKNMNFLDYNYLCMLNAIKNFYISLFYKTKCVQPNLDSKYILWTMSVQPERNTNPLSGNYFSDYDALKEFCKVNNRLKIYLKEHPRIFSRNVNWIRASRSIEYYKKLAKLKNVFLIDKNYNNQNLIKHSQFVLALNGSSPFKAILMGKPAAIFGTSWYNNLKLLKKIDSVQLQKKFLKNYKIVKKNYHQDIIKFCINIKKNSEYIVLPSNYNKKNYKKNINKLFLVISKNI